MRKYSKIILAIIAITVIVVATIIYLFKDNKEKEKETHNTTILSNNTIKNENNNTDKNETSNTEKSNEYEKNAEIQMEEPEEGETIAVIHVKNYGDISVKFFNEVAPKAVENFITHSKEGYYNGVIFHRVINEFMIQGGDPKGTGYGGESIWGKGFEEEISNTLVPYRGSLCMASRGYGSSSLGSQFFITQAHYNEKMEAKLKQSGYSTDLLKMYKIYGGYLSLYKQYTVFGQVIEGMDIVDKIASVKTDSKDKPTEDVIIESIEIKEYKK